MIRINLLPFRAARKKENIRRQISIFLLLTFFIAIVLVYYNLNLSRKITRLTHEVAETQKEVARYKKITKQIDEIKKKLAILRQKRTVIEKLELNRFEPVNLLDTMSMRIIPERMWFTKFESKGNNVNIYGIAMDNTTVADFMVKLEGSGLFNSVKLKTIKKYKAPKENEGAILKSFQISCGKVTIMPSMVKKKNKK